MNLGLDYLFYKASYIDWDANYAELLKYFTGILEQWVCFLVAHGEGENV